MTKKLNQQSFLDRLVDRITLIAEPLAKFARMPVMASIQDGFAAALPLIVIGSLFLILGAAADGGLGFQIKFLAPLAGKFYVAYTVGMGFMGLYVALATGIAYAKRLDVPEMNAALLVVASYLGIIFNDFSAMSSANFGAGAMFVGLLVALLAVKIFSVFLKKNLTIKLPDLVPPNIVNAFTSLIPYGVIITLVWLVRTVMEVDIMAVMTNTVQPLIGSVDNIFAFTLDRLCAGLFWAVGIHWDNMTSSVTASLMMQWTAENAAAVEAGVEGVLPHIWTYGIHNWAPKAGYCWSLMLMLYFSKAPGFRQIAVTSFVPSFFCIMEVLWFSVPVVLNPYMMFGLTVNWVVTGITTYLMFMMDWCTRCYVVTPWAAPDFLSGYLQTGGDWRFLIIMGVNFVVGFICWFPFFKAYERATIREAEEKAKTLETAEA